MRAGALDARLRMLLGVWRDRVDVEADLPGFEAARKRLCHVEVGFRRHRRYNHLCASERALQRPGDTDARGTRLVAKLLAPQIEHRHLHAFRGQRRAEYPAGLAEADESHRIDACQAAHRRASHAKDVAPAARSKRQRVVRGIAMRGMSPPASAYQLPL